MTDNLTEKQRSYNMSRIRSKWTFQERKVHEALRKLKIKHKMHPKMKGNPDLILPEAKLVVFLHGCFWHKCPVHYKAPKSNVKYWSPKINKNVARDRKNIKLLEKYGWKVITLWEHDLKRINKILPFFVFKRQHTAR